MSYKHIKTIYIIIAAILLMTTVFSGCGKKDTASVPSVSVSENSSVSQSSESEPNTTEAVSGRQDGERFEEVIILEGMEETVSYEHVRNDTLGFEMDFDYELFDRNSGALSESFVSKYDIPDHPENYLTVTYDPQDAGTVAAAVSSTLSNTYDIIRDDSFKLESGSSCIRIDASNGKGNTGTPDLLQMVYIIPAPDGCRIARAHYSFESAEGFGRRFNYFMNTFSVIASSGEKRITDEAALSAVKNFCCLNDPSLSDIINGGEYPVYWDISSSDDSEIVVVFRSYTGALIRYYIDPVTGAAYVTEFVPGITPEEERTDETLNIWDHLG